jgi:hypothetical protein
MARKLAELIITSDSCLYSQWCPGDDNLIADSLSQDFHIPSPYLSYLLHSHFPLQAPFGLTILPLTPDIISWLTCLLRNQLHLVPLPTLSERVDMVLQDLIYPSNWNPSGPPWIAWHRPSRWLIGQTPDWMETINLDTFYSAN